MVGTLKPAHAGAPVTVTMAGIGAIGRPILTAALADERIEVRACVDGREDLREVAAACGFAGPTCAEIDEAPPAMVLALLTSSRVVEIAPHLVDAEVAAELDRTAREHGRTLLACGVNPGFCMDVLPLVLTMATRDLHEVRVVRRTDPSRRRRQLQEKLGVGLSPAQFKKLAATVGIGHVGLRASTACLADALGWAGDVDETIEPVLDDAGSVVLGVRHRATGRDRDGRVRIHALLEMYAGVEEFDEVAIHGVPSFTVRVPGGVPGDEATVSAVLNSIAGVGRLPPGLLTPLDLVPPAWRSPSG